MLTSMYRLICLVTRVKMLCWRAQQAQGKRSAYYVQHLHGESLWQPRWGYPMYKSCTTSRGHKQDVHALEAFGPLHVMNHLKN